MFPKTYKVQTNSLFTDSLYLLWFISKRVVYGTCVKFGATNKNRATMKDSSLFVNNRSQCGESEAASDDSLPSYRMFSEAAFVYQPWRGLTSPRDHRRWAVSSFRRHNGEVQHVNSRQTEHCHAAADAAQLLFVSLFTFVFRMQTVRAPIQTPHSLSLKTPTKRFQRRSVEISRELVKTGERTSHTQARAHTHTQKARSEKKKIKLN